MHTYLGGFAMLQAVQGCVRYVFNVGIVKLDFFDRIPILFGRLKEPEVRARCIEQWEASSKKDEASAEFMDEQGPLRDDVDDMNDDGTNVSVKLDAAIEGIKDIPLDDTVGEGPHAVANAISQRSRGCTWAWTASTMRLTQNLQDAKDLVPAVDTTLELQWHLFKNVVQLPGRHAARPKRMTRKLFEKTVYHLGAFTNQSGIASDVVDDAIFEPPAEVLEDGHFAQPANHAAPLVPQRVVLSQDQTMIREFLNVALKPYEYYSVPVQEGDILTHPAQNIQMGNQTSSFVKGGVGWGVQWGFLQKIGQCTKMIILYLPRLPRTFFF